MGFETQEQAEAWAENMEFRADQCREERMLMSDAEKVIEEFRFEMERVLPPSYMPMMHRVCNMARTASRLADASTEAINLIDTLNGKRKP